MSLETKTDFELEDLTVDLIVYLIEHDRLDEIYEKLDKDCIKVGDEKEDISTLKHAKIYLMIAKALIKRASIVKGKNDIDSMLKEAHDLLESIMLYNERNKKKTEKYKEVIPDDFMLETYLESSYILQMFKSKDLSLEHIREAEKYLKEDNPKYDRILLSINLSKAKLYVELENFSKAEKFLEFCKEHNAKANDEKINKIIEETHKNLEAKKRLSKPSKGLDADIDKKKEKANGDDDEDDEDDDDEDDDDEDEDDDDDDEDDDDDDEDDEDDDEDDDDDDEDDEDDEDEEEDEDDKNEN